MSITRERVKVYVLLIAHKEDNGNVTINAEVYKGMVKLKKRAEQAKAQGDTVSYSHQEVR